MRMTTKTMPMRALEAVPAEAADTTAGPGAPVGGAALGTPGAVAAMAGGALTGAGGIEPGAMGGGA